VRKVAARISYIVGAFDMRRELPRTALSLCAPYQRDMAPGDIEILIADNGSTDPVDPAWFASHPAYTMSKYGMSMAIAGLAAEFEGRVRFFSPPQR
jgi:hypothetical protein